MVGQPSFKTWNPRTSSGTITQGTPLGKEGGAGCLYEVAGNPDLVIKLYHDDATAGLYTDKLVAMLENPPCLEPTEYGGRKYLQIAWPTAIVRDRSDRTLGYVMPRLPLSHATELENMMQKAGRKLSGLPEAYQLRVLLAYNMASLLTELHRVGHHVIDMKPVNMSIYKDVMLVVLLDCDGFSIRAQDGSRYSAMQYTPGYRVPEALNQNLSPSRLGEEQDRFALAVIIFRLLNNGLHPYQGRPASGSNIPSSDDERVGEYLYAYGIQRSSRILPAPPSIHEYFKDDTRVLFDRAFGRSPANRPTAGEWRDHLGQFVRPGQNLLVTCKKDKEHSHFSKGCGWCALEAKKAHQSQRKHAVRASPQNRTTARRRAQAFQTAPTVQAATTPIGRIRTPYYRGGGITPVQPWWHRYRGWLLAGVVILAVTILPWSTWVATYSNKDEINRLLILAKNDFRANHLISPNGKGALEHYQAILKLAPGHDKAGEGVRSIANRLNTLAKQDIEALRLTTPKGNNAHERYKAILKIDSKNSDAIYGMRSIVSKYLGLAEGAFRKLDFEKADHYFARAANIGVAERLVNNKRKQSFEKQVLQVPVNGWSKKVSLPYGRYFRLYVSGTIEVRNVWDGGIFNRENVRVSTIFSGSKRAYEIKGITGVSRNSTLQFRSMEGCNLTVTIYSTRLGDANLDDPFSSGSPLRNPHAKHYASGHIVSKNRECVGRHHASTNLRSGQLDNSKIPTIAPGAINGLSYINDVSLPVSVDSHVEGQHANKNRNGGQSEYDEKIVLAIQTGLKQLDYYKGRLDGIYGQRTKAAIRGYQSSKHYSGSFVDGRPPKSLVSSITEAISYQNIASKGDNVREA